MRYRFSQSFVSGLRHRRAFFVAFFVAVWLSPSADIFARYRFDSWTTDNGLPQASVNSILQTRDGFLWMTTFGGLVRYDGLRFQVFNSGITPGLKTSRLLNLFEDKEGSLWITTEGQGITRYRDGNFKTFTTNDGLPDNLTSQIENDAEGRILLVNDERIYMLSGERFVEYVPANGEPVKGVLHRTPNGAVWYREGARLKKFENGRVTIDYESELPIRRVFEDSKGRAWLARDGEDALAVLQNNRLEIYEGNSYPKSRFITAAEDRQGAVWFGTRDGLARFQDDSLTAYRTADGLISNQVTTFFQDREGTIWVGMSGGLNRLTEQTIAAYSASDGLAADNIYPIYQDRQGKIWIGSWLGLSVYENGIFRNVSDQYAVSGINVTALFEDREGVFWVGGWSGEIRRLQNGQAVVAATGKTPVRVIYQDRAGTLWFGTGSGLLKSPASGSNLNLAEAAELAPWSLKLEATALSGKEVFAVHEDRNNQLWVGTNAGLVKYRDGIFTTLMETEDIASNIVRSIYEDADGALWIGTYDSGLYRYQDEKFTRFTTNEGLFDNGAFQIIEDAAGDFWVSCNIGIYRVKKSELNDFADGLVEKVTSIPYNKRDGMLNSECNGGASPAGIRASDGRIWFPTQKGVAVINPGSVPFNPQPPPVVIESLIVDAKPVDARQPVTIQPDQTNLEIHYSGLSFINPELVKFKYRLENLDAEWIDASTRRTAFYSHLPPGKYTFRVTAANRDGVWNEAGIAMEINVLPPFYRTWWFLTLAVCVAVAIVYIVYRQRIGRLKKAQAAQAAFARQLIESQETERRRIAVELHDSLGQSLVLIKNWALLGLKNSDANKNLDEISETATEAINEVREIAYNLGPYQLERIGLKNTIEEMIQKIAKSSPIVFYTDIDKIDGCFTREAEINIFRIVQETASNIVKHSAASRADLEIKKNETHLILTMRDDGKGFAPENSDGKRGFGLLGMTERVHLLKGELTIDSESGQGTTVKVILPCST